MRLTHHHTMLYSNMYIMFVLDIIIHTQKKDCTLNPKHPKPYKPYKS